MGTKRSHTYAFKFDCNIPAIYCRNCASYPNRYFTCPSDYDRQTKRFTETSCPWNPLHCAVYLECLTPLQEFPSSDEDIIIYDPIFRIIPKKILALKLHYADKTWNWKVIKPFIYSILVPEFCPYGFSGSSATSSSPPSTY
jgi:hypothetical protein